MSAAQNSKKKKTPSQLCAVYVQYVYTFVSKKDRISAIILLYPQSLFHSGV